MGRSHDERLAPGLAETGSDSLLGRDPAALIAASRAAWSRSFWSAYDSAKVAIAWSNASSVPR